MKNILASKNFTCDYCDSCLHTVHESNSYIMDIFFKNQLNFIWKSKMFIFHLSLWSFIPSLSCLWPSNLLNPDA